MFLTCMRVPNWNFFPSSFWVPDSFLGCKVGAANDLFIGWGEAENSSSAQHNTGSKNGLRRSIFTSDTMRRIGWEGLRSWKAIRLGLGSEIDHGREYLIMYIFSFGLHFLCVFVLWRLKSNIGKYSIWILKILSFDVLARPKNFCSTQGRGDFFPSATKGAMQQRGHKACSAI